MEDNTTLILLIIVLVGVFVVVNNKTIESFSNMYNPFNADYGYILEHKLLNDVYNWPYYNSPCIIPGETNMRCVRYEINKGAPYYKAIRSCTSLPSIDSKCSNIY